MKILGILDPVVKQMQIYWASLVLSSAVVPRWTFASQTGDSSQKSSSVGLFHKGGILSFIKEKSLLNGRI